MDPGSFAMVMATGIVSTAAFSSGLVPLAWGLFQLNKVVYVALWALTAVRLIAFRPAVVEDLTHR
ncbi:MAG TPA: C4-dicarboxylate ABC transporter, partial [bacterium]|nr:C4-dicarboxylate ABC transporter [bacterium]